MFKIVRDKNHNWIVQLMSPDGTSIIQEHLFLTSRGAASYIRLMMEWVEN